MQILLRKTIEQDKAEIISMMREFYASEAVFTNGSDEIFDTDFENCINNNPYLEGYVFCSNNEILGYAMLAKSFSTEFGKPCIWIEDLYLKPNSRGVGITPIFLKYIKDLYPNAIFKLEVEEENARALHTYKKLGFEYSPYLYMQILN